MEEGTSKAIPLRRRGGARSVEIVTPPRWSEMLTAGVWSAPRGGVGQVHHVAFRTPDDGQQAEWLEHAQALEQRELMLDGREQELAQAKQRWEPLRVQLQQEALGGRPKGELAGGIRLEQDPAGEGVRVPRPGQHERGGYQDSPARKHFSRDCLG